VHPLDVIVLAGGKGTRLHSVVSDRPKPLATVCGRPFLDWLLLYLRGRGLGRVVLATGYRGEMVRAACGDGSALGLELHYAQEEFPLGTGGAARLATARTTADQVLVLNGDSFCPFDVARLAESHQKVGARATLWLTPMDDCRRYGSVERDGDGQVHAFHEKSDHLGAGLINAGIYLFERTTLDAIPDGRAVSLETEVFPNMIGDGLYSVLGTGPFLDIGTPESFGQAASFITENQALWDDAL
jgi:NDP-sugar pyrophosphorylase family protein